MLPEPHQLNIYENETSSLYRIRSNGFSSVRRNRAKPDLCSKLAHRWHSLSGSAINSSLVTGLNQPDGVATDGAGNLFVANMDYLGKYTTSGATVSASLIPLGWGQGVAVDSQGDIFVDDFAGGLIAEYSKTGTPINTALITGLHFPTGLAVDNNGHLFVANETAGTIGEYTTSGAVVNASLITGLNSPDQIALDGHGDLFVANYGNTPNDGWVGKYTTSGGVVNASLITGLANPVGIALDGLGNLFVSSARNDNIGEYTTSGTGVNANLITGLNDPSGLVIVTVPEPGPLALTGIAAILFSAYRRIARPRGKRAPCTHPQS